MCTTLEVFTTYHIRKETVDQNLCLVPFVKSEFYVISVVNTLRTFITVEAQSFSCLRRHGSSLMKVGDEENLTPPRQTPIISFDLQTVSNQNGIRHSFSIYIARSHAEQSPLSPDKRQDYH